METYQSFKYEIVLGEPLEMPKPPIDYYKSKQYTVQQFLHSLCKEHIGSLGKKDGRWVFGPDAPSTAKLGPRSDITQLFDYSEKMGIIKPAAPEDVSDELKAEGVTAYKLSQSYMTKFDKFAE